MAYTSQQTSHVHKRQKVEDFHKINNQLAMAQNLNSQTILNSSPIPTPKNSQLDTVETGC